jgi:aminoglycoside 3-N-acetyltransferase I
MAHQLLRIGPDDLALYDAAMRVFADAFDAPEQYLQQRPTDTYLTALLSRQSFYLVVACDAQEVVAALTAYEWDKFERQTREIYIYDVAVTASHRRRGIGRALLQEMQTLAAKRDATALMVQSDADDPPAQALYRSFAAAVDIQHFELKPNRS